MVTQDQLSRNILSDLAVFMKYARYNNDLERRETYNEIVDRNINMHVKKFPHLEEEIRDAYSYVYNKQVLPSMRSMQFAGLPIELSNTRMFNCAYRPANSINFFSEIMFQLLSGTGIGYSVQQHHIDELPPIKKPNKYRRYLIGDSIAGWADAIKILIRSFLDPKKETRPIFDYRDIREKGALLVTSGGKAPGPEPLKICLTKMESLLEQKEEGSKLTPLEVHDLACFIADAVLAGGIRRCLPEYYSVKMENGEWKKITDVKVGDIISFSGKTYPVKNVFDNGVQDLIKIHTANGQWHCSTPEHKWMVRIQTGEYIWGSAETIANIANNKLMKIEFVVDTEDADKRYIEITSGEFVEAAQTYDIEVDEVHLFNARNDESGLESVSHNSAMISFFSPEDTEMMACKTGEWYVLHPERARANNSVVLKRNEMTKEQFDHFWEYLENSGSGEPGFIFTNDIEMLTNPCLTGDMRVAVADKHGTLMSLKELSETEAPVPVYTLNKNGEVTVKHIRGTQVTRRNADVYKVTLDNGDVIKATGNHKIRLSSGEWKEINSLQHNESLWQISIQDNQILNKGYSTKISNIKTPIISTLTDMENQNRLAQYCDHSNDLFDALANDIENGYDAIIQNNEIIYNQVCEITHQPFQTKNKYRRFSHDLTDEEINNFIYSDIQYTPSTKEKLASMYNSLKIKLGREPSQDEWNDTNYQDMREYASTINHRVISVEYLSKEDVYDGIVDDTHNFFVTGPDDIQSNGNIKHSFINVANCGEIALSPFGLCNLTTINGNQIKSQEDLNNFARSGAFIGTLQASYTDFYYLSDRWRQTAEKEALLGLSITGWASGVHEYDLEQASRIAVEENKRAAKLIGINPARRVCCVKPEGTSSLVLGSSSGIHPWHSPYYIRRMRVSKAESIYDYLANHHPELVEDEFFSPEATAVISVPQKAPEGAIVRNNENAIQLLERVKDASQRWITPGHVKGHNQHNVSSTISVKHDEWLPVREFVWKNREYFTALTFLPFYDADYKQMPFEEIDEAKYNELVSALHSVDLTQVVEADPTINHSRDSVACAGGACEI